MNHDASEMPKLGRRLWVPTNTVKTKICRIDNLGVALDSVLLGADALGYHIMNPARAIEQAEGYRSIIDCLPHDVANVLVTRLEDIEAILRVIQIMRCDTIQIQTDLSSDCLARLRSLCAETGEIRILKVIWMARLEPSAEQVIEQYREIADGFILDSGTGERGGTGQTHDWIRSHELVNATAKPVLLSGGLNRDNVTEAVSMVRPYGVDVQSGVEHVIHDARGMLRRAKSVVKIREFIETAKSSLPQNGCSLL